MTVASAKETAAGDGLIIPSKIPGDDLSPENIRAAAAALTGSASTLRTATAGVDTSWTALPVSFVAPDAQVVYAAMTPASESARTFAGKLDRIAKALHAFADELGPVKSTLKGIKKDALDFLKDFDSQHRVWVNARDTKKYEFDPKATGVGPHGAATGEDPAAYLRSKGEIVRMHGGVPQIKASWLESSWHVDRNNQILDRVADAYAKVNGFEVECGDKINKERDDCVAPLTAVEAWQLKQSGDNTVDLPWGHRVEENRNCGESIWHGFGSAGLQTLQGLGGLVLGYDPARNEFWRGDAYGKAWTGTVTGLGSLLMAASPTTWLLSGLGVPVFRDATNNSVTMLKGLVSWDEWSKNPGEAFGSTAFNVLTFLIPGVGEVGGAVKAITMGTKLEMVANALTKVEEVTSKVTKILPENFGKLFDDGGALDRATIPKEFDLPKTEPRIDVPGGTHLPDGHAPETIGQLTSHETATQGHALGDAGVGPAGENHISEQNSGTSVHETAGSAHGSGEPSSGVSGSGRPLVIGDASNPPVSGEDFSRLSVEQKLHIANVELSDGAKTFTNSDGAQYGADHWNEYARLLPQDEVRALHEYTTEPPAMPSYVDFNGALRGNTPMTPELQTGIDAIDKALMGSPTTEDIIVNRGTGFDHWTDDPADLVGEIITEPGYLSTSLGDAAFPSTPAVLHLRIPAGTPALYVETVSAFAGSERELLLGRGLEFRIDRTVLEDSGKWQIFAEVITHG